MSSQLPIVYVIAGPTAVGKTAVSIALAQRLGTAIVSADSRQCYRGMTIGTAKPSAEELAAAKHYFIDTHSITEALTAADYEQLALQYIGDILQTHHTAVVCGGTGLYIQALCAGLDAMPPADPQITAALEQQYAQQGIEWLQQAVAAEDPQFYEQGEVQNPARLLRALAFIRTNGTSIVNYRTGTKKERPFRIVKVGLELPREVLYQRINHRVDIMMQQGLLQEVKELLPYRQLKNLQTVGYAELFDYLEGNSTLDFAVDKIKQHSRNYAKRQLTWFKKDKEYTWFSAAEPQLVDKILALGGQ